jgi:hypothetical protein
MGLLTGNFDPLPHPGMIRNANKNAAIRSQAFAGIL